MTFIAVYISRLSNICSGVAPRAANYPVGVNFIPPPHSPSSSRHREGAPTCTLNRPPVPPRRTLSLPTCRSSPANDKQARSITVPAKFWEKKNGYRRFKRVLGKGWDIEKSQGGRDYSTRADIGISDIAPSKNQIKTATNIGAPTVSMVTNY